MLCILKVQEHRRRTAEARAGPSHEPDAEPAPDAAEADADTDVVTGTPPRTSRVRPLLVSPSLFSGRGPASAATDVLAQPLPVDTPKVSFGI